jgi:hypothetical protein
VAYTDVFTWGTIWGAAHFSGHFDGDPSGAIDAGDTAFSIGNAWDGRTFTASFSIDTSGLYAASAAADQVAAHIAAVMPHSPAKEGPLKEPITFDYIADEMKSSMSALVEYTNSGVATASQTIKGLNVDTRAKMAGLNYQSGAQTWRGADRAQQAARVTFVSVHSKDWQKMVDRIEATGQYIDEFESGIYQDEGQ